MNSILGTSFRALRRSWVPACILGVCACSSSTAPTKPAAKVAVKLWIGNYSSAGGLFGYTAGQLDSNTTAAVVVQTGPYLGAIAFDSKGALWVAEPYAATLVEYTPDQLTASGSPTPAVTLSSTAGGSLNGPMGLAFDASGNLWVANSGISAGCQTGGCAPGANTIVKFALNQLAASGSPTPTVTLSPNAKSISIPEGLAFDPAGNLWLSNLRTNGDSTSTVVEFSTAQIASSGSPLPAVTLSSSGGSLQNLYFLTFDGGANLWVSSAGALQLVEFNRSQLASSGNPSPAVAVSLGEAPTGLVFDFDGNVFWTGRNVNTVYELGPKQITISSAPESTVLLSGNGLAAPAAIAFAP